MPEIYIASELKGFATPGDLLVSHGMLVFNSSWQSKHLLKDNVIFRVTGDRFIFELKIENGELQLRRNEVGVIVDLKLLPSNLDQVRVDAYWNIDKIRVSCGEIDKNGPVGLGKHGIYSDSETTPASVPISIVAWARKQSLIPHDAYNSEEEFRSKVYGGLASIQEKINKAGAATSFWNIEYDGQKIIKRTPKKEPDIHPIINCILSDHMLLANIEVIPEYKAGVGDLDFLFIAPLEGGGFAKLAVEFKRAHANDLEHGLETQLPAYMRNIGTNYGAYCVLGFKGDWFGKPNTKLVDLDYRLKMKINQASPPVLEGIRVFTYDLSKPISASKA